MKVDHSCSGKFSEAVLWHVEEAFHDFFNLSLNTVFSDEPSCKITPGRKVRPDVWSDVKSKR